MSKLYTTVKLSDRYWADFGYEANILVSAKEFFPQLVTNELDNLFDNIRAVSGSQLNVVKLT